MTSQEQEAIAFSRDLPFTPTIRQIVYVEKEYDPQVNVLIREHYAELRAASEKSHTEFCYLPYISQDLTKESVVRYLTPYRLSPITQRLDSTCLNECITQGEIDHPSLIFCDESNRSIEKHFFKFVLDGTEETLHHQLHALIDLQEKKLDEWEYEIDELYSACDDEFEVGESEADEDFPIEAYKLMDDVCEKMDRLRHQYGIKEMVLQKLLKPRNQLSRLHITIDGRILLTDYGNREIKMSPLVKAVYFLFLRHSDGIIFKNLPNYRHELFTIYSKLSHRLDVGKMRQSIIDVTNPCENSINEKCARIREAFLREINKDLAENYYITGERSTPKGIL